MFDDVVRTATWKIFRHNISSKQSQTSRFFSLPWELRLEIYEYIVASHRGMSITTPPLHPIYPLLFVCQQIRHDVTPFFYPPQNPEFTFTRTKSCLEFLFATRTHTSLLTTLTIYLPADDVSELSSILKFTPNIKSLSIHLHPSPKFVSHFRPNAIYNLPRRTGLSENGKTKIENRNREDPPPRFHRDELGERDVLSPFRPWKVTNTEFGAKGLWDFSGVEFHYTWSNTHDPRYISIAGFLDRYHLLEIPKLDHLRYIAVYGRPVGKGRVLFELWVVLLHEAMKQRAEGEGKKMIHGWGCRQWKSEIRYFDAWIEGEFDTPLMELSWLFPAEQLTEGRVESEL